MGKLLLGVVMALWTTAVLAGADGAADGDCRPQSGFDRGYAGVAAVAACAAQDYRSAWRLGSELAALEAERRQLLAREGDARHAEDDAGRRARRVRQLSVDIEAIGAALQLRGIVQEGPRPPPATDATQSASAEAERS